MFLSKKKIVVNVINNWIKVDMKLLMEEIEKISDGDDDDLVVEAIWSIYLMKK